jgi:hypothetical protein
VFLGKKNAQNPNLLKLRILRISAAYGMQLIINLEIFQMLFFNLLHKQKQHYGCKSKVIV